MKTVLIVDDEPDIVDLMSLVLTDGKTRILTAYDGEQALQTVREERPQLVLTDIMMPRLDGYSLCRQIRSDPVMKGMAIILMSALQTLDSCKCAADEYINKPFDVLSLRETVGRLLACAA